MLRFALIAAMAPALSGCIVGYVPGPVASSIRDSITGERGNVCVGPNIKVGDRVSMPTGGIGTVQSLDGKSYRCKEAVRPIRAVVT